MLGGGDEKEDVSELRRDPGQLRDDDELEVVEAVLRERLLLKVVAVLGPHEPQEVAVARQRAVAEHVPEPGMHLQRPARGD